MTPETRAALALAARGLSPAAIERVLPLVGVDLLDTDDDVATRVDALAADLPGLFPAGDAAPPPAPLGDGRSARERADEVWSRIYPNRPAQRRQSPDDKLQARIDAARSGGGDAA